MAGEVIKEVSVSTAIMVESNFSPFHAFVINFLPNFFISMWSPHKKRGSP